MSQNQIKKVKITDLEIGTGVVYKDNEGKFFRLSWVEDSTSPRERGISGRQLTFYTWIEGYRSPDACNKTMKEFYGSFGAKNTEELLENMDKKGYFVKPVYAMIHSGIYYSFKDFRDPYDSGLAGFIFVPKKWIVHESEASFEGVAEMEVKEYSAWANGEVWAVERLDKEGNVIDGSHIVFGEGELEDIDDALREAMIAPQWEYEVAKMKTFTVLE